MSRSVRMIAAAALALSGSASPVGVVSASAHDRSIGDITLASPTGIPPWVCQKFPFLCQNF